MNANTVPAKQISQMNTSEYNTYKALGDLILSGTAIRIFLSKN